MNIEISFPISTPERHKKLFCGRFEKFGYRFTEVDRAPFLVATPHIYVNKTAELDFLAKARDHITIFDAFAEALFPDFNLFDYGIGTDEVDYRGRMIYSPLRMYEFQNLNEKLVPIPENATRRKFCNFLYSNAQAHPMRDAIFHALSKYKKVDSLGKHLNNTTGDGLRCGDNKGESWLTSSINIKSQYKFTIAAENARYYGYCSEKLPTTFMARSIPIYWGSPSIHEDYDEEAFVNVSRFKSLEECVEYIAFLDTDEEAYLKKLSRLPRTAKQEGAYTQRCERSDQQLRDLFPLAMERGPQKGAGTWPDIYIYRERRDTLGAGEPMGASASVFGKFMKWLKK